MISLSVKIPFFNESERVVEALNEVRRPLLDAENIAVDDGGTDEIQEKILRWSGAKTFL